MTLYEKYIQQKERYCAIFEAMKISYNKNKNSITYTDGRGDTLSVQYTTDMKKIENVFVRFKDSKWKCIVDTFANLGSERWYYDFSGSSANPFSQVVPLHLSAMEKQGLFDVMMELANDYIKQEKLPVILGIKYGGYGYACTPIAVARKQSEGLRYKEHPYDENILYTKEYCEKQLMAQ